MLVSDLLLEQRQCRPVGLVIGTREETLNTNNGVISACPFVVGNVFKSLRKRRNLVIDVDCHHQVIACFHIAG